MYVPTIAVFWAHNKRTLIGLGILLLIILTGLLLGMDARLVAAMAALFGLLSNTFAGLAALIALVPWAGPIIIKVLSLPLIWLMNGAGYFTAIFLAKRGHSRSVVDSRILTVVLLVGIIIGYILGKII
jgi:hypothetical protein